MTSGEKERRSPTVLICEDDAALREFLQVALDGDFAFAETADGLAAVELARTIRPDLVLIDVMLPGKSGLEILRELRADPELQHTPVVMMTAFSGLQRLEAEEAGADHFLSKPFDPLELIHAVEGLLARGR